MVWAVNSSASDPLMAKTTSMTAASITRSFAAKEFFINWTNKSFNNINGYLEIYKVGEDSKIYPYNGDEFVKFVNDNSKTT